MSAATETQLGRPFVWDGELRSRQPGVGCLYFGVGAPTALNPVKTPRAGSFYFRTDTVGVANQNLYVCTVGGTTPTWVALL